MKNCKNQFPSNLCVLDLAECSENWVDKASLIALFQYPLNFQSCLCKIFGRIRSRDAEIQWCRNQAVLRVTLFLQLHINGKRCKCMRCLYFFCKTALLQIWKRLAHERWCQSRNQGTNREKQFTKSEGKTASKTNLEKENGQNRFAGQYKSSVQFCLKWGLYILSLWHLRKMDILCLFHAF